MDQQQVARIIKAQFILPLYYHAGSQTSIRVAQALYAAGIRCIEYTNRGPQALANFQALAAVRQEQMPDLVLAAGTILTAAEAADFIRAGADCLISPVFDSNVNREATAQQRLWIPGCMTPTEIHQARNAGCKLVKLFPGNVLTPGFVEGIKPLFSGMEYLVTGGVDATIESMRKWKNAGVAGVGLGSKLINADLLATENYEGLRRLTAQLLEQARQLNSAS